jgi:hypothetical protein
MAIRDQKYEKGTVRSCKLCGSCLPAVGIVSWSSLVSCDFRQRVCVCSMRLSVVAVIAVVYCSVCSAHRTKNSTEVVADLSEIAREKINLNSSSVMLVSYSEVFVSELFRHTAFLHN